MALDETSRKLRVSGESVQTRFRGKVSMHIGKILQEALRQSAAPNRALGIQVHRIQVCADVAPPGLRVTDEMHLRVSLQYALKALDPGVVRFMLEMNQHGEPVLF